jgi:hypothetical protein
MTETTPAARRASLLVSLITATMTFCQSCSAQPAAPSPEDARITMYPPITNISSVAVANPNKGWTIYSWGRMPRDLSAGALENASTIYLRTDWGSLEEHGEGKFDWSLIDSHLADARAMGKRLAIRIMALNPHSPLEYTFPKWVVDGHEKEFYKATIDLEGRMKDKWFPHDPNTSPRWKYACRHLAEELGKRYNGNPDIAFIEIGSIGDWGEQISNYAPTNQMLDQMPWREHLSWYRDAFPDTPLISVCGGQHFMKYEWADENGFGRRTDGFCAPPVKEDNTNGTYQDAQIIRASFDKRLPSFVEFPPGTDPLHAGRGFWWGTFWKGLIDHGKPTYIGYNFGGGVANELYQKYPYRLIEAGNRSGYHLVIEQITMPPDLLATGTGDIGLRFRNDGCRYPDYPVHVAFALLDSSGQVIETVWADAINLKDQAHPWVTYEKLDNHRGRFVLPVPRVYAASQPVTFKTPPANARLAVGLFTDRKLGTPNIRLGIEGRLPSGWYPIDQYPATPQADLHPSLHDLAIEKRVTVSATASGSPAAITDGNASTDWTSPAAPGQWVSIDLGRSTRFGAIMIDWKAPHPGTYTIEVSENGAAWTQLSQTANARGGIDYVSFAPTPARHVRLSTQDPAGLGLHQIEVLGSTPAERPARRRG